MYTVLTSGGELLETDDAAQFVAWLDEYGPEAIDHSAPPEQWTDLSRAAVGQVIGYPKLHTFESSGEAYDVSQCDEQISDGDVLSVPSEQAVAILVEAWPIAISENHGQFHPPNEELDWEQMPTTASKWKEFKDYSDSFELATKELARIGGPDA